MKGKGKSLSAGLNNLFKAAAVLLNPNKNNRSLRLILGLSIGLPIGVGVLFAIMLYFFVRNKLSRTNFSKAIGRSETHTDNFSSLDQAWIDLEGITKHTDHNFSATKSSSGTVSNAITQDSHIRTPQMAHCPLATADNNLPRNGSNLFADADNYLYSHPPNIYSIDSSISMLNAEPEIRPNYFKDQKKKNSWKYNSPLSKWFLRSSLYLQCSSENLTNISSLPNVKCSNILTSVVESCVDKPEITEQYVEETYLGSLTESSINTLSVNDVKSKEANKLNEITGPCLKKPAITLSGLELPINPNYKKNRKKAQMRLRTHLDYLAKTKPLPLTPTSSAIVKLKAGIQYRVREEYVPSLSDEIHVTVGETVRVLASHNDGWALVERIEASDGKRLVSSGSYINENRGIIPNKCLLS